ncbi:uncharacterized protein CANTADRAFT_233189 [Suhomyces tanzawaensis NRRL Y-17324]|uniref:Chromatin-remodeling complexes subunit NGG1 n=1 Tax=Suhomyces tanzawaensis NRRL Y-17324 TaxID=984487 RepID=A0A1E4SLH5_9ASCO|nr:uncharacterized protein CANTADRAFT_233189 [Suhomyces tanzawaensis NRRL Y-17324]ODV80350.1 hypothetical protein CANTADRAFT_233189 [Suhomyces tanzawaensis NRRL Y-17324]
MSNDLHSASTTLDDIINELKLTYDVSVGLLDGDSIRDIPNLNTLSNLNKLLKNLSRELHEVEQVDEVVLSKIEKVLKGEDPDTETLEAKIKTETEATLDENRDEAKRVASDLENDDETINVKRRKLGSNQQPEDQEEPDTLKEENIEETDGNEERVNSKDDPVPPVQSGSYTQNNDTRLKNPKSEFVTSQTLSTRTIEQLGLFSEDNNGLETHGKEYLKKKYGVSSYPESDLQNLLPGQIPNIDFSKGKPPANQVQFTTYQTYIEPYFRTFTNEDLDFLNEEDILPPGFEKTDYDANVTPFIIPKLGPLYSEVWIDEDASLSTKLNSPAYQPLLGDSYKPKGSIEQLSDEMLYTEEISCGPLSSRLISAILGNNEANVDYDEESEKASDNENEKALEPTNDEEVATKLNSGEDYRLNTEVNDFYSVEERLKRELKYIGIFMNLPNSEEEAKLKLKEGHSSQSSISGKGSSIIDDDDWIRNKEDDEVCAEIRALQKQLRESSSRNRVNKKKLIPSVEEHIAYQEYSTILDDLDKQVDQAYIKRLKGKNKKKKQPGATPTPQQHAVNSGLRGLLEKRRRWIDNIGKLFPAPEIMKRVPDDQKLIKEGDVLEEPAEEENGDTEDLLSQK